MSNPITIQFTFEDETNEIQGDAQTPILENILSAGFEVPYSCQAGACCSCQALIKSGETTTENMDLLSDDELDEGFRLTCQAIVTSEKVVVDYDAV